MFTYGAEAQLNSFRTLRRIVGALGIALPLVLAFWGFAVCANHRLQPSISDYYYCRTRDGLVGILWTIGWFLFAYPGYEWKDRLAGIIGGICALGVALSPDQGPGIEPVIHFTSATLLFLTLAYFSLFLFTKSDGLPTPNKIKRNRVYRTCGVVMVLCILTLAALHATPENPDIMALRPVFWLESLALWAFGISWAVKGEVGPWRDRAPLPSSGGSR
jgi:heme A synthase